MPIYCHPKYDAKSRFVSYWHQINEILQAEPEQCLEIGIGNGLVSRYVRDRGIHVTTLDLNPRLSPDVVGTVLNLPALDRSFDVVSCCEVLEHLPYDFFIPALRQIWRVSRRTLIMSLPDVTPVYRIDIELPRFKPIRKLVPHPFPRAKPHVFDGEHHWEIGKKQYPLERIMTDIRGAGFRISETYRIFEFTYHRFFLLQKKPRSEKRI
jgi:ubiquinone/menaquinone biosynthesis C-methylase UbiE